MKTETKAEREILGVASYSINLRFLRYYMRHFKLILFSFLFSLHTAGQTDIQLIVKNPNRHKIDKVDAFDYSGQEVYNYEYKDTLNLHFNKTNIDCYNIRYFAGDKMFRQQLWLNTGKTVITAHIDSSKLIIDSVLNSPFYYHYFEVMKTFSTLHKNKDTVGLNSFLLDSYLDNIENPFSLFLGNLYMGINLNSKLNLLKLKSLIDRQGKKFEWFTYYQMVTEQLNGIFTTTSLNFNDFELTDIANKQVRFTLKDARYYILDFWFLACPPCIKDHISINRNLAKLRTKGIAILSISTDDNFSMWRKYLQSHKYKWQNFLEDKNNTLSNKLGISSFPTYVIIDANGSIQGMYNSFSDVLKKFQIEE